MLEQGECMMKCRSFRLVISSCRQVEAFYFYIPSLFFELVHAYYVLLSFSEDKVVDTIIECASKNALARLHICGRIYDATQGMQ